MKESSEVNQKNLDNESTQPTNNSTQNSVHALDEVLSAYLAIKGMAALELSIPSNLEKALGYARAEIAPDLVRFVAFYWDGMFDQLVYDDGRVRVTGANWEAWIAFKIHPAARPEMEVHAFGETDVPPSEAFVLDRLARRAYAIPIMHLTGFLKEQWLAPRAAETLAAALTDGGRAPVSRAELEVLLNSMFQESGVSDAAVAPGVEAVRGALEAQQAQSDAMLREMDSFVLNGFNDAAKIDRDAARD